MAQVPHVSVDFDGDSVRTVFDFDFPYRVPAEIFVTVDKVAVPYTFVAGSTHSVEVRPAPVLGTKVRIYRSTLAYTPLHVFDAGVPFLPRYVDDNNRQLLYAVQEAISSTAGTAEEALAVAEDAKETAQEALDAINGAIIDSSFALRRDLASPAGSGLVGHGSTTVSAELTRHNAILDAHQADLVTLTAEQVAQKAVLNQHGEALAKLSSIGLYPGQHFARYNGGGQLKLLAKLLGDPFVQMLGVCYVGDSITWGMTTTGMNPITPRGGALTDARNNGSAPTWANLFHKWLGREWYDSTAAEAIWPGTPNGVAQFTYTRDVDLFPGFTPFTQVGSMSQTLASGSTLGLLWFVNMSSSGGGPHSFSWKMTGDSFDLVFGATPEGAAYRVYVDDVLQGTFDTSSVDMGLPGPAFKQTRTHNFPFKRDAVVRVEAVGANVARDTLRIEAVRLKRKLRVTNQGIIGIATERYRKVLLADALRADDSIVLVQLGTNDSAMPAAIDCPTSPSTLAWNMGLLLDGIAATAAKPILLCANDTTDPSVRFYPLREVRNTLATIATNRQIDFVDQYALTTRLKDAGVVFLDDGLHPNDLGHYFMFENLRNSLSAVA